MTSNDICEITWFFQLLYDKHAVLIFLYDVTTYLIVYTNTCSLLHIIFLFLIITYKYNFVYEFSNNSTSYNNINNYNNNNYMIIIHVPDATKTH